MKGFFKPKLIFAIVTVLMLAVAAAVPLASSLGQSHAASATQNAAQSSSTNTPKCVVHSNPSMVEMGEFATESSIADIIQVECLPKFSQQTVTITSAQFFNHCQGRLSWSSPFPLHFIEGPEFTVTLDNEGNATAAVWGGPSCAAGRVLITASLNAPPFTTVSTHFTILPPINTTPGVTAHPSSEVEDAVFSSVATVIQVEFPSVQAEKVVNIRSQELFTRCAVAPHLTWVGPDQVLLGAGVNNVNVTLDNNGNAFVVVLGGPSCASGPSTIVAELTTVPFTTYTTHFRILSPRPTCC